MMGLYIMGMGQGTGMGTNGFHAHFPVPGPVPCPVPIPGSVQCEQAIMVKINQNAKAEVHHK